MDWLRISSDWGRVGPIWWVNSDTRGHATSDPKWRWMLWGQVVVGGQFAWRITWLKA